MLRLMQSWPQRFSIIDFYLAVCDKMVVHGAIQPGLRLLDVGKMNSLAQAEEFANSLKMSK